MTPRRPAGDPSSPGPRRVELVGHIGAAGFASGDRIVVGAWTSGPLGPMVDVMWAQPSGRRVLLAPSDAAAEFITSVYRFDHVDVVAIDGGYDGGTLAVTTGLLTVQLTASLTLRLPPRRLRPEWLTRHVESPLAHALLGVRTYGVTPTGVREWYRADRWSRVASGAATIDDVDLGPLRAVDPPCRFGFSEPPRRPSITALHTRLEYPPGS